MNKLDKQYLDLLEDILTNGIEKENRTGINTISVFGREIRHKMSDGFPLLTTKKMAYKQIVTELLWFLRGESNIQSLVKDGNYIWVGDSYQFYKKYHNNHPTIHSNRFEILSRENFIEEIKINDKFAEEWGEMGPIYGKQWRDWNGVDQIMNLINDLKTNPDSRRLMVSAWNVSEISEMKLPPCHYGFQLYTKLLTTEERINILDKIPDTEKRTINIGSADPLEINGIPERSISLMWQQRSIDTPLGSPFNIASYGLLLEILAKKVNMIPDELIGNFGDTHIYKNQIDGVNEQLNRKGHDLCQLSMSDEFNEIIKDDNFYDKLNYDMFKLNNYISDDKIYFPLSN